MKAPLNLSVHFKTTVRLVKTKYSRIIDAVCEHRVWRGIGLHPPFKLFSLDFVVGVAGDKESSTRIAIHKEKILSIVHKSMVGLIHGHCDIIVIVASIPGCIESRNPDVHVPIRRQIDANVAFRKVSHRNVRANCVRTWILDLF